MLMRLVRGMGTYGLAAILTCSFMSQSVYAAESGRRQIEEVVVTAERKESTVSDTSISISAFTGEFLEDFGVRNQEDLQNLIPAAVIEPYDMAIRGVGRNFRALGGDPGIATYSNGVYSEDFGIASTEGGLFDIERIEVLRGPQGTLYGRNAIGGAVNFINKFPTEEFEGEARVVLGDYDLQETYGVLSGPLVDGLLQGRLTGVKRTRDGYYDDLSGNPDPGNYGDENYAVSFRLTPNDSIEINTRANERSYRRRMAGADAAGIINFNENNGNIDFDNVRDNTTYAWGYRAVDTAVPCPDTFTRTDPTEVAGIKGGVGCTLAGAPLFSFINPRDGSSVTAQRVVPGIDSSGVGTTDHPNRAFGTDLSRQRMVGLEDLDGGDLKTDTNGQQDELFDHQANTTDISWQINDQFSMKYIFGYTDYFYDRTSDVDLTSNTRFDEQFYVSQETEYVSHELQFFLDPTEDLTITSGLFYYDAKITQRGDFYDSTCTPTSAGTGGCASRYANDFAVPYAAVGVGFLDFTPKMDLFTARKNGEAVNDGGAFPFYCLPLTGIQAYCFGKWAGDTGDRVPHGPNTAATSLEYQTRSERYAFAAYTQAEYTFNDQFAVTLGVRWARDQLEGEENLFYYAEDGVVQLGFGSYAAGDPNAGLGCTTATCTSNLAAVNAALGYVDPTTGAILDVERVLTTGLPTSQSLWRELERKDDDVTWRVNLDWTPTEDDLIYVSATKGFRAGGFNLVFFSTNAKYSPESLIAYEIGYKGEKLDGQMQINSAIYFYDYENVHTFGSGPSAINPANPSTSVFAVPAAEMIGWDTDVLWLATDRITIGANFSYTKSEYTEDFLMIDSFTPQSPESLFNSADRPINIEGNQMLRVPEMKAGAFGQYSIPLSAGRIELMTSWSWIDKVYFSAFENDDDSADAYQRFDFRGSWISSDEAWTAAVFVNNILDEIGIRQIDRSGEEENFRRSGAVTDPRLIGVEVRYKFGAFN